MAKKRFINNQTAIDAAMLTYGRQEAVFLLHSTNANMVDTTKKVPEVNIPGNVAAKEIAFDEQNRMYDLTVDQAMGRATGSLATGGNETEQTFVTQRGFSSGFSIGFK